MADTATLPGGPVASGPAPRARSFDADGAIGAGIGAVLDEATALVAQVTATLDPACLRGEDALALFRRLVHLERLATGAKTLLAGTIDASGVWRGRGKRDAAAFLAEAEGVPAGQARDTLATAKALPDLPGLADAVREGRLSGPQAHLVADAAKDAPTCEQELLDEAASGSLLGLRDRCREVRAAHGAADHLARSRRIHRERHLRTWTDAEGAFCFTGRALPEVGAALRAAVEAEVARARGDERGTPAGGEEAERPTYGARCLDALVALVCEPRAAGTGPVGVPSVVVRVDLGALRRGEVAPGETCVAEGVGPLPVPSVQALLSDAVLRLIFTDCDRITAVSTATRTLPAALRAALGERDRHCVVPGCAVTHGLEIDHVLPFAEGGPTELGNLARLCHWHHYLKTYEGWTLTRLADDPGHRDPGWRFTKSPDSWP